MKPVTKDLHNQLMQAQQTAAALRKEIKAKQHDLQQQEQRLLLQLQKAAVLEKKLQALKEAPPPKPKSLRISDHARRRYVQRIMGVDMEEVDAAILNPQMVKMVETLGPKGLYPIGRFVAVVEDNVIVTIKPQ